MKVCRILLLSVVIALPRLALAASSITPQSLATEQAILDFCTRVDPSDAASFRALQKTLTGGRSEHDLEGIRGAPQYKDQSDLINDALAKVSKPEAIKTCATGVTPTHVAHGERRGTTAHPRGDDRRR
jgi:hypothetical protein